MKIYSTLLLILSMFFFLSCQQKEETVEGQVIRDQKKRDSQGFSRNESLKEGHSKAKREHLEEAPEQAESGDSLLDEMGKDSHTHPLNSPNSRDKVRYLARLLQLSDGQKQSLNKLLRPGRRAGL